MAAKPKKKTTGSSYIGDRGQRKFKKTLDEIGNIGPKKKKKK